MPKTIDRAETARLISEGAQLVEVLPNKEYSSIGAGAPFRSRCPVVVTGLCERSAPGWTVAEAGHEVACHRFAREGRAGLP